jgi:hypothetical protein
MADLWGTIKGIIGKVAPILGNAILPGIGGSAGAMLAEALGVENKPEVLEERLKNLSPEDMVKIKELTARHEERLLEIAAEKDRAYLTDVQSARQREVDMARATGRRDVNMYVLGWTVVGGFFGLCFALMRTQLPMGSNEVVFMLFGALSAGFSTVLGYFFGSSRGSADKNDMLAVKK